MTTLNQVTTLATLGLAAVAAVYLLRRPGEGTAVAATGASQVQQARLSDYLGMWQGQWATFAESGQTSINHLYQGF